MAHTRTNTSVRFFNEDDLEPLRTKHVEMVKDWQSRTQFLPKTMRIAGQRRLDLLEQALVMLAEPADSFYDA